MEETNATNSVSPANPNDETLRNLFLGPLTVAVVGLSPKPDRDSHKVAAYLQKQGHRVVPVNPVADRILGQRSYPDLGAVPFPVDVVDIFRRPEAIPQIVEDAIAVGARTVWMQLGLRHPSAARRALEAGLTVVQDRCIKLDHQRLLAG